MAIVVLVEVSSFVDAVEVSSFVDAVEVSSFVDVNSCSRRKECTLHGHWLRVHPVPDSLLAYGVS